jgi:hypothetical protein
LVSLKLIRAEFGMQIDSSSGLFALIAKCLSQFVCECVIDGSATKLNPFARHQHEFDGRQIDLDGDSFGSASSIDLPN